MLYATTRSNVATYTAQRALKEERSPEGGFYLPTALPVLDREELDALLREPAGEIVARIVNAFFKGSLSRLDVEFILGRSFFGIAPTSHRIFIGELWRNADGSFYELCRRLTERLAGGILGTRPGAWMRIVCRTALVFAMFGELRRRELIEPGEQLDAAVLAGDFEGPFALWTAKRMGLPIGQIVCCCNENSQLWDLLNRGQMKLGTRVSPTLTPRCDHPVPDGLELIIRERLEWSDAEDYMHALEKGGTYTLGAAQQRILQDGFAAAVVSDQRIRTAIPNLYRTNGYILCPYSALVYMGLMDYRSRPGPRRAALVLSDYDPRACADTVKQALDITDRELKAFCRRSEG